MPAAEPDVLDVVVVGAGFSGLYLLHRLREQGLTVQVLESAEGLGGTWYWNRYPGARCDVDAVEYGFSFSKELDDTWEWDERFATQGRILEYLNHVADTFDLRRDIRFGTRVAAATWDDDSARWTVRTEAGDVYRARYTIMATGCLSVPKQPDIPGLDSFAGPVYFTSSWPHREIDFTGRRVGVIGTGSSAVQAIPLIAAQAAHLTVFQRTPNWVVPAHNRELTDADRTAEVLAGRRRSGLDCPLGLAHEFSEANLAEAKNLSPEDRRAELERLWERGGLTMILAFADLLIDQEAGRTAAAFVAEKIRARVHDPATAEKLIPSGYPFGAKRLCVDTNYFEAYNRDTVDLVDLRATPIETITPHGLRLSDGEVEFDDLVMATGFDAMTGALTAVDIRGRGRVALADKWSDGPRTYLGLSVAGFPNLFTMTGPGSPSVLSNMRVSIEQHVDWIAACIRYLDERGMRSIEASPAAEEDWVRHVAEVGEPTVFSQGNSWYVGANVPGKPRVFMPYIGGVPLYRETCADVAAQGYRGFQLTPA
jgi:cyclohexanone monooxygenase